MTFLYLLFAAGIIMLLYMRFEAGFLKVERIDWSGNKNGLIIAQLSDIHIKLLKVPIRKVKKVLDAENPDLLVITGDYIESPKDIPAFIKFLEYIKGPYIILLCFGNHDYTALCDDEAVGGFIKKIEHEGIKVLHNESVCVSKNNSKYNIAGIEDLRYGKPDVKKALSNMDKDSVMTIAFSHNPDAVFNLPEGKVDCLLCGHFHGGQIWTPWKFEFRVLRDDKLCRMGITRGMHRINGTSLYINRGLGNVLFPFRFLSRPEITILKLP